MSEKISEGSVPVHELKMPNMGSVRRFIKSIFVVLLAIICVFVGVLIYHLHTPLEKTTTAHPAYHSSIAPSFKVDRTPTLGSMANTPNGVARTPLVDIPLVEEDTEPLPSEETDIVVDEVVETIETPAPAFQRVALPVVETRQVVSLTDALSLRDHLLTGDSCLADLQIIMKNDIPNMKNRDNLVDKLMPICTSRSAFKDLQILFNKNRKAALMTYYRLNNPTWLAYLKAFGTSLVDIRRIHPLKRRPKDIIFQAQDAMVQKHLRLAVRHIKELPPAIHADFQEFLGLAEAYIAAQKEAEELVLSFEEKGEGR